MLFFTEKKELPIDRWRDVAYGRVVVYYRPENINPYRTQLTVGGYRVNYPGYCGKTTVDLLTVKLLLKIVVSTPNEKSMTIDVKYFYLNTTMARSKYMRLKLGNITEIVVQKYKLEAKATKDGYVHAEIRRGMYDLPYAGIIEQQPFI